MKKLMRKMLGLALAFSIVLGSSATMQTYAAGTTTKTYTINTGNTVVYSNTGLTKKYGTIYAGDEITVISITQTYTKVSYPVSKGTKTGYIKTSSILSATGGNTYTARAKITAYKRPGGASYGYIAKNDKVVTLGTKGNYVQVRYPVSGGYKFAWVSKSAANNYIYPVITVSKISSTIPSTSKNSYYVNGVDIGYKPGSYFTDNGKACTDHKKSGIHSFTKESACNCIATYNGKSLGAVQCYGFAMYVQLKMYGVSEKNSSGSFYTLPNSTVASGKLTTAKLKQIISSAKVGAHLRTNKDSNGNAHSMIITNITSTGFSIIQCNGSNNKEYSGYSACRIGTYTYTWSSYVNSTYGKRGIAYVKMKR